MRWDLEELVEDAIVGYLRATCSGDLRISAAWERDHAEYPAVVVAVLESQPISESATWHNPRQMAVRVAVITERAHVADASGNVLQTAREAHALARSQIANALFVTDLLDKLITQGVPALAISMAQFATTSRAAENEKIITTYGGDVIAEPVEGT
jgi:hypothetical protein